jgi:hypothetical protein
VYDWDGAVGTTATLTTFEPVQPPASVAVIVAEKVPVAVGVPVTAPVEELMVTPAAARAQRS